MNSDTPDVGTNTAADESEPLKANMLSASLTTGDIQASLAWYRDVLGLTVARTFEREGKLRAVSLRAGDVPILLTQDDGGRGTDRLKGEGISLRLTTSQNIDVLARRIREKGGTLDSEPADMMGVRAFRLRDPDGFKLLISSEQQP